MTFSFLKAGNLDNLNFRESSFDISNMPTVMTKPLATFLELREIKLGKFIKSNN